MLHCTHTNLDLLPTPNVRMFMRQTENRSSARNTSVSLRKCTMVEVLPALSLLSVIVLCAGVEVDPRALSTDVKHSPLHYTVEVIKDWNRKHQSLVSDVLLFDVGASPDVVLELLRRIPTDMPVMSLNVNQCSSLKDIRKPTFIVVATSAKILSTVSTNSKIYVITM